MNVLKSIPQFFIFFLFLGIGIAAYGQSQITPLNFSLIKQELNSLTKTQKIIELPQPDGSMKFFEAVENNTISGEMKMEFPQIKTYDLFAMDGSNHYGKMTINDNKFYSQIQTEKGWIMISPSTVFPNEYKVFYGDDDPEQGLESSISNWECGQHSLVPKTKEKGGATDSNYKNTSGSCPVIGDVLRTYRLAIVVTGEFYAQNGNNPTDVNTVIANTVSGWNLIYKKDLSVAFTLLTPTLYANSSTDPFTPDNDPIFGGDSRTNQAAEGVAITFNNADYDIGHVFHNHLNNDVNGNGTPDFRTGGVAGLGVVCSNATTFSTSDGDSSTGPDKAAAWSGGFFNTTNNWINLSAHEVGHQFGAEHTFNGKGGIGNCTNAIASNFVFVSGTGFVQEFNNSYEIASGNTIMSYSQICDAAYNYGNPNDTENHYFHNKSIEQMMDYICGPGDCPVKTPTGNTPPTVNADPCGAGAVSIPIGTPFKLTAESTDADGDAIEYTWEQIDEDGPGKDSHGATLSLQGDDGLTAGNSTVAPLFRGYPPSAEACRYFPNLEDYKDNINTVGTEFEVLPQVARTMNFSATVRDCNAAGGGYTCDNRTINVNNTGPLVVNSPCGGGDLTAGDPITITWDANGSEALCTNVQVLMSIDGGCTFPYTLSNSTAYSAETAAVTIPAGTPSTEEARFQVVCADNPCAAFYAFSPTDCTINSDCQTVLTEISPDNSETFVCGDAGLNLSLSNNFGSVVTSFSGTIETTDPATNLIFDDCNPTVCTNGGNTTNYDTYLFIPDLTGSYTFTHNLSNLVMNLYENPFIPGNCSNHVVSSATRNSGTCPGSGGVVLGFSATANLTAGTSYTLLVSNFSSGAGGFPAFPALYTISFNTPAGANIFDGPINPPNYEYTYAAVSQSSNTITAVSSTSDFTSLDIGCYDIYGVHYENDGGNNTPPADVDPTTFVGQSIDDVLSSGACALFSSNSKEVCVTESNVITNVAVSGTPSCSGTDAQYTICFDATGGSGAYDLVDSDNNNAVITSITGQPVTGINICFNNVTVANHIAASTINVNVVDNANSVCAIGTPVEVNLPACGACIPPSAPMSGGDKEICANEMIPPLTVTVVGGETADWYSAPTGGTLLASGTISYIPSGAGTFYAEARNTTTNCTSDTRTAVTLTINALPTVSLALDDDDACVGDAAITLSGGDPTGGTYSIGVVDVTTFDPNTAGTTTVTYSFTDVNGCSNTATDDIVVSALPSISTTTNCSADLSTYNISVTTSATSLMSDVGTVVDNGGGSFTVNDITSGTDANLSFTDSVTGCSDNLTVTAPDCNCPTIDPPMSGGDQEICDDDPIPDLMASVGSGETVDWYDAASGGNLLLASSTSFNTTMADTYYAETRNTATGCTSNTRTAVSLTINPTPSEPTPAAIIVCSDDLPVTLVGPAGYTYLWFDASTGNSVMVSSAGNYTLTISNTSGCEQILVYTVVVNPNPTYTTSSIDPLSCGASDGSITITGLTANTAYDVSIDNGVSSAGLSSNGSGEIVVGGLMAGSYDVIVSLNACSGMASNEVLTDPSSPPAPTVSNVDYCLNETAIPLTANGSGGTFTWYVGPVFSTATNLGTTAPTPSTATTGTTTYWVTETLAGCTGPAASLMVTVAPLEDASFDYPTSVCISAANPIASNIATAGGTFSVDNGGVINTTTGELDLGSLTAGTTYTITYTTSGTCFNSSTQMITVTALDDAGFSYPLNVCINGANPVATAIVTIGGTFSVDNGGAINTATGELDLSLATAGTTYTITYNTGGSCSNSSSENITVNALPSISTTTNCSADLATYSISVTTSATSLMSDVGTVVNNGGGSFTVNNITSGTAANLSFTDSATGCSDNLTVTAPDCNCPTIDPPMSGGDQEICDGDPIPDLMASIDAGETVDWYDAASGGNLLLAGSTSFMPTASGIFYAETRNTTTGCTSSSRTAVNLTINNCCPDGPSLTSTSTADFCSSGSIVLNTAFTNLNSGTGTFVITGDNGLGTVTAGSTISLPSNNGCDPIIYTFTASATCDYDNSIVSPINPIDLTVSFTVYPAFNANLLNTVIGTCLVAPSLSSSCNNYQISLNGDADDITTVPATGESGNNNYTVTYNGGPGGIACFNEMIAVPYNCSLINDVFISDPCSCGNPENIDLNNNGVIDQFDLVADVITVTVANPQAGEVWTLANAGNALDATGTPIPDGTVVMVQVAPAVYELQIYSPSNGSGFGTLTFTSNMGTPDQSITKLDGDGCDCTICLGEVTGLLLGDNDCDGIEGEPLIGITLELLDGVCTQGVDCRTTVTDGSGIYEFDFVPCGSYQIFVAQASLPCLQLDANAAAFNGGFAINYNVTGVPGGAGPPVPGGPGGFIFAPFACSEDNLINAGQLPIERVCQGNALYMTDPIDGTVPFDNSSGEWEFRWYLNGADIPIAVNNTPYFSPTIAGNYTVQAVNFNTCLIYETQTVGGVGFEVVEIINCKNCP